MLELGEVFILVNQYLAIKCYIIDLPSANNKCFVNKLNDSRKIKVTVDETEMEKATKTSWALSKLLKMTIKLSKQTLQFQVKKHKLSLKRNNNKNSIDLIGNIRKKEVYLLTHQEVI